MPCTACGKNIMTNTVRRSSRGSFAFSFSRTATTKPTTTTRSIPVKTTKTKVTRFRMNF